MGSDARSSTAVMRRRLAPRESESMVRARIPSLGHNRPVKPFTFIADAYDITDGRDLAERARRAESLGVTTFSIPDHLVEGNLAPIPYLATVAAATTTLRIAAFVHNHDLRHPAVLAQDLATLDVLSGGRLDVALGAGWNKPEYDAIGLPFDPVPTRQARLEEAVAVIKGCFGEGPFSFHGEFYDISDYQGFRRPAQQPHPPIFIGGGGRRTLSLAGRAAKLEGVPTRLLTESRREPK